MCIYCVYMCICMMYVYISHCLQSIDIALIHGPPGIYVYIVYIYVYMYAVLDTLYVYIHVVYTVQRHLSPTRTTRYICVYAVYMYIYRIYVYISIYVYMYALIHRCVYI